MAYSKTPVTRTSEGMFLKLLLPVCKMEMPSQAAPPGLSDARGLGAGGDQRQLCSLPLCPGLTGWRLVLPTPGPGVARTAAAWGGGDSAGCAPGPSPVWGRQMPPVTGPKRQESFLRHADPAS